jgi:hypothetical protein
MKLKTLLAINAVLAALFGVLFVLFPTQIMNMYGFTIDTPMRLMVQLFGASSLGYAVISWQARNYETDARRMLVLGLFVGYAIGFVIVVIGQFSSVANAMGWLNVALYFLLAAGFGYFQFSKQG